MSHHNGYNVLCGYSGVLLLVSAALIAAQSDQPTTISLAEKILLKIGNNRNRQSAYLRNLFLSNDSKFSASGLKKSVARAGRYLYGKTIVNSKRNICVFVKRLDDRRTCNQCCA